MSPPRLLLCSALLALGVAANPLAGKTLTVTTADNELVKLLFYSLDRIFPMSFSSFMALPMSPLIFSLPVIKAAVAFSLPWNILVKSLLSMIRVASTGTGDSPLPADPDPFFRSSDVESENCVRFGNDIGAGQGHDSFEYFVDLARGRSGWSRGVGWLLGQEFVQEEVGHQRSTWFDGIFVEIGNTDLLQNIFIDTEVPSVTLRVAGKNDVSSIRHDLGESQRIHGVLTAHQFTQHVHRRSGDTGLGPKSVDCDGV